jgi:hypothetical protein
MSVKVVSPTESGQPQLPMSLRPPVTPAAAGTHHGRPRRPPSADAESGRSRLRAPGQQPEPGQPELPMPLRTPAAAEPSAPLRPPVAAEASASLGSQVAAAEPPAPLRPPRQQAEPGQPELPMSLRPPVADEPSASLSPQVAAAESPAPLRPPVADVAADADADRAQAQLPMSLRPPAPPVAAGLLAQARRGLAEAERETAPGERFIGAYLAALRGAAAVLAARGRPHRGRARPASTWVLLDSVAPELREWSAFFAGNSAARAAAQAGITGKVTAESAAELVRAATSFLELVRRLVHGLPITGEAHVA